MNFDERLGDMRGEARRQARARHGVPLVAHAAGIQHERPLVRDGGRQARRRDRHEARLAVLGEEAAVGEQPRGWRIARRAAATGTARSRSNASLLEASAPEISKARSPSFSKPERRACSWKISSAEPVGERLAVAEPPRHLAQYPPVRPCASRQRQERALARDAPLGVGDRAVLLAPGGRRQAHVRMGHRVVAGDVLGDHQQVELGQRRPHRIRARQRHRRDWCPSPTAP